LRQTIDDLRAHDAALQEFESVVKAAADGFDVLKKAQKAVDLIDKALVNLPDSVQKDLKKQGKEMSGKIDSLMELYMLPSDVKGYQDSDAKLQSIISEANSYLGSAAGQPGSTARYAATYAKNKLQATLDQVNQFIDGPWQEYSDTIKGIEFDLLGTLDKVDFGN
jgi:hypothetical protein